MTATLAPGSTWALLHTAPTPVTIPQPTRAASSSGKLRVDPHAGPFGNDRLLAERRGPERGEVRGAVGCGRVRRSERVIEPVLAQLGVAAQAEEARPARRDPREHDVIAGTYRRHIGAGGRHHARALVSEDGRQRVRNRAVLDREIGVAHAAGRDAHLHVARSRGPQPKVVDHELVAGAAQHRGFHDSTGNRRCRFSAWRMPGENEIGVPATSS